MAGGRRPCGAPGTAATPLKNERRKALNDPLIYLRAAWDGCAVRTLDVLDFDWLMQLDGAEQAACYRNQHGMDKLTVRLDKSLLSEEIPRCIQFAFCRYFFCRSS
jgi:hypothetical protein